MLPPWPTIPGLSLPPGLPVPTSTGNDVAQRCVDGINRYRATLGLPALARWGDAESCAASESRDDSITRQAHGSFGRCGEMAQNACPAWPGPPDHMIEPCLQSMWNEGPGSDYAKHGHYLNMANAHYTQVACGHFVMPSGDVWAVQDFR